MAEHPGMVDCARCGGGIWPETPTFPYCEYCAAKIAIEPEKKGRSRK